MYLVTESKRKENQLGYAPKTKEYVYLHHGKEVWREKGDESLLNYFHELRCTYKCLDEEEIAKLPTAAIWKKYTEACESYSKELFKKLGITAIKMQEVKLQ